MKSDNIWLENNVMFYLNKNKTSFRCSCGCNIFRKNKEKTKAKCNGCNAIYSTK